MNTFLDRSSGHISEPILKFGSFIGGSDSYASFASFLIKFGRPGLPGLDEIREVKRKMTSSHLLLR